MKDWLRDALFYVCGAAMFCFFVSCWLVWRMKERWRIAAQAKRPQRPVRAHTQMLAHLEEEIEVTDDMLE